MRTPSRPTIIFSSITLALAARGSAQSVVAEHHGEKANDALGARVAAVGDVDQDGHGDWATVAAGATGAEIPYVLVISGKDGSELHRFQGPADAQYGGGLAAAGDLNLDGYADVIVGAAFADTGAKHAGAAWVHSGADGSVLASFQGPAENAWFGAATDGPGDLDQDGVPDLLIGSAIGATQAGVAQVFSGATQGALYTFHGDSPFDLFGLAASGAGDVNNDGVGDVIVGGKGAGPSDVGIARVYSGANGGLLLALQGTVADGEFGSSVSEAGDVNGDGFDDLIVGADEDDTGGDDAGAARVFSGNGGALLHTFLGSSDDSLGFWVDSIGDLDGDGRGDVIIGAPHASVLSPGKGRAQVRSGATGATLFEQASTDDTDLFGNGVAGIGDSNLDGRPDFVVGAPFEHTNGPKSGAVFVYSGCSGQVTNYGAGCPGSGGFVPRLAVTGCPVPGESLTLTVDQGLGPSLAIIFFGAGKISLPLPGGCELLVWPGPSLTLPLFGAGPGQGSISLSAVVPSITATAELNLQAFVQDPSAALGYAATNGVTLLVAKP